MTADEVRLYRTLTWIRRRGCDADGGILGPRPGQPLLDAARESGFATLADDPGRELVVGTLVVAPRGTPRAADPAAFAALRAPGVVKAAMSFRVEPDGRGGSVLSTETRVAATDARALRRFTPYWRAILPGSALIRREWLRAIDRRATAAPPPAP